MRRVYNQKNLTVTVDGITIQDFHEGGVVVYTLDGGEVQKTQGTDGAGINIATNQGSTLAITLRETSRSRAYLQGIRLRQENGGPGVTIVMRTGANVIHTMIDSYMGREGELSTGDKMQAGIQYTFMSAEDNINGLSSLISTAGGTALGVAGVAI